MKKMKTVSVIGLIMGVLIGGKLLATPFDYVEPSDGFKHGNWRVSPFAEVLYFYDTNYDRRPNASDGNSGPSIKGGIDYSYSGVQNSLSGNAWYLWENYNGESRLDNKQWRESLRYMYETPQGTALYLDHFWGQTKQSDLERGQWQDRRELMLGGGLAHAFSPKTRAQIDFSVNDIAYENKALYDWRKYAIDASLARRIGAKTDAFITSGLSLEENEDYGGFSKAYRFGAGLASRATEKINYRVAVGAEAFDYNGRPGGGTDWSPYYQLGATWRASRKWIWTLTGRGEHRSSEEYGNNYTTTYTMGLGAAYQANRRLSVGVRTLWRYDESGYDVIDPMSGRAREKRDHEMGLRADVNYRLSKYASIRIGGEVSKQVSTLWIDEYNRFRVDAGLVFRY